MYWIDANRGLSSLRRPTSNNGRIRRAVNGKSLARNRRPRRPVWKSECRIWCRLVLILVVLLAAPALPVLILRFVDPPTSAFMLIRRAQGYPIDMRWRPLEALAPILPAAVVAAEDPNFCRERLGFDVDSMAYQVSVWRAGGRPTGASTIAMQLSRNLFLWPEHSLLRKALEAWITPSIALVLPRRRQLEIYLNIVEFGPGAFGVEAGAQHWFGIGADAMTSAQATLLVTILPAPLQLSPLNPSRSMEIPAATVRRLVAARFREFDCAELF
jgi:monofunctional glycosyltransferase